MPVWLLAVKAGAMATPEVPAMAVTVNEPLKLPLAPLAGAAKVTIAPLTGLLFESLTLAWSGVAKAVPTVALCGVPAVALTEIVTGATFVRLNRALDAPFMTLATTR